MIKKKMASFNNLRYNAEQTIVTLNQNNKILQQLKFR